MRVSGSGHSKAEGLRRERAGGSRGAEACQLELGLGDQRSGREREGAGGSGLRGRKGLDRPRPCGLQQGFWAPFLSAGEAPEEGE